MIAVKPTLHERPYLLPLNAAEATLASVGGKGANLARLARAGFPVPDGFLVTTRAYDAFVQETALSEWIAAQLDDADLDDPDALAVLSTRIRSRFQQHPMPHAIAEPIRQRYERLGAPPVAVRSSATAEDLPDMSFAGQQDTFLNVQGSEALLNAVRDCWSSLWTARAIGYRTRNGIDHDQVSLAVVVQKMVPSDVSGVLFTANPLNGRRTETVIDATWGLGEALVGGLVEPDHYVVDNRTGRILEKRLGAKATVIRSAIGGGTVSERVAAAERAALTDDQIRALTRLGQQVVEFYDFSQDIEWAYADGELYLLQSRPITSLYPLPPVGDADNLHIFLSLGAVQGVLDPFTPLGQETLKTAAAGGASMVGLQRTARTQGGIWSAGERLWLNLTPVVRTQMGRAVLSKAVDVAEPGAADAFRALLDDPRLAPTTATPDPAFVQRIRPLIQTIVKRLLISLLRPEAARAAMQAQIEAAVAQAEAEAARARTLAQRIALHERIARAAFPLLVPNFLPRVVAGYLPFNLLLRLARHLEAAGADVDAQTVYTLTRGLPHNVTTEMDLALWQTAQAIRRDPASATRFRSAEAARLAEEYQRGELPPAAQEALRQFLDRYGTRGVGEIDFGRARWRENPTPVIGSLQSYLTIDDAPDAVFRRGEAAAADALARLARAADQVWGPLAGRLVRWLARRMRTLAGLRESPKFTIIRLFGVSRAALLQSGQDLVRQGVLDRPDDLFFLTLDELKVVAMDAPGDWRRLVAQRRAIFEREKRRRLIPRLLLSDGTAIYDGMGAGTERTDGVLVGSPVSAGVVEGSVRVVFDPHGANLQPGEILVCPGTDPAWTPLFLAAGGLVMEVGGLMTHGSVVAREYGIPAVVGVDRATERLQTGQRVRVDGSQGTVVLLDQQ